MTIWTFWEFLKNSGFGNFIKNLNFLFGNFGLFMEIFGNFDFGNSENFRNFCEFGNFMKFFHSFSFPSEAQNNENKHMFFFPFSPFTDTACTNN